MDSVSHLPSMALVWVSHGEARIFSSVLPRTENAPFMAYTIDRSNGHSEIGSFLREIQRRLGEPRKIVILGPDLMKFQLRTHLLEHVPALYRKIAGFESAEAPRAKDVENYFAQHGA